MRRISYKPYVFLIVLLLFIMSFPERATQKMRSFAVACLVPSWQGLNTVKFSTLHFLATAPLGMKGIGEKEARELERLRLENQALHGQLDSVRHWLLLEERIESQMQRLKSISHFQESEGFWKQFFKRRGKELCQTLDLQMQSLPAKVVFREPASWSSSLWLNVGEKNNEALGKKIVAKNSPVIIGSSIVGVVEYVGRHQCKVMLITDSGLVPAVRAVRGDAQNQYLLEHLGALLRGIELREELFSSKQSYQNLVETLRFLQGELQQSVGDRYMAKGELFGSSSPLWRSRGQLLKGIGFNYDFADVEGPARDLRSGASLDPMRPIEAHPLLKVGDLLVTSGLDGVFPAGFRVATVAKICSLREGGCSYELEAVAAAGDLDEIMDVSVLPPMEFEKI